jgi:D-alanine-D-alanine ligase
MGEWMSSRGVCTSHSLPVIVVFNEASPHTHRADQLAEQGVLDAVGATVQALARAGYSVETLGIGEDFWPLIERLRQTPSVVVNYCEAFGGSAKGESLVASVLELLGIPYTGSPPEALALCLNKIRTKRLLAGAGLPTPAYMEYTPRHDNIGDADLSRELDAQGVEWPALVKAASEDASQGLDQRSVCQTIEELRGAVARIADRYGYPVLIEQFIDGREFNACIVDDPEPRSLPLEEVKFDRSNDKFWPIVTYDSKWVTGCEEDRAATALCPTELDEATADEIARLALEAVRVTGCRDYARVDLRLTADGKPYILEVNSNPDLGPDAGVAFQLEAASISLDAFIVRIVENAIRRRPIAPSVVSRPAPAEYPMNGVELRQLKSSDRRPIQQILQKCENFRPEEIEIGLELVDEAIADRDASDYQFIVATRGDHVMGYACFGRVPAAENVWDLYWIAVDPEDRGHGVGHRLHTAMEKQICSDGGRMILAETSSLAEYAEARSFYLRQGYQLCDRIVDFYKPGDDRMTFGKRLHRNGTVAATEMRGEV